jgi:hypothetical protein
MAGPAASGVALSSQVAPALLHDAVLPFSRTQPFRAPIRSRTAKHACTWSPRCASCLSWVVAIVACTELHASQPSFSCCLPGRLHTLCVLNTCSYALCQAVCLAVATIVCHISMVPRGAPQPACPAVLFTAWELAHEHSLQIIMDCT